MSTTYTLIAGLVFVGDDNVHEKEIRSDEKLLTEIGNTIVKLMDQKEKLFPTLQYMYVVKEADGKASTLWDSRCCDRPVEEKWMNSDWKAWFSDHQTTAMSEERMNYEASTASQQDMLAKSVEYGKKFISYYKGMTSRTLAGALAILGVKQRRVDFEFGEDEASWTCANRYDSKRRTIHLGLAGFANYQDGTPMFESVAEWHMHVRYIIMHEIGHILYTTERAWKMAQENGTRKVVTYIAEKALGHKVRITDNASMQQTIRLVHDQAHLNINMNMIREMVHFVTNSIEDGGMERRVASSRPGFKADVRIRRGKYWQHTPVTDELDPDTEIGFFFIVCNQILTLATTGLWQKDFMDKLSGTKVESTVRPMIPKIRDAVTAYSCKRRMQYALEIIDDLCPFFYDACVSDVNDALEQALQQFMDEMAKALPDMNKAGQKQTEYTADEKSDAEAEKKDKAKDNDQNGQGKNDADQNGQNGEYQLSEDGTGSETGASFNIFTDDEDSEEESKAGKGIAAASGTAEKTDQNGNSAGKGGNAHSGSSKGKPSFVAGGDAGSKGQDVHGKGNDMEAVEKAMEEAAKAAEAESLFTERTVRSSGVPKKKETSDMSSVEDSIGDISSICCDFNEYFRKYRLTEDLPTEIQQECRVARARYEHYFVSRRKPTTRGQRSGNLDRSALTRVCMRNLDVFTRPGEDNSFSGAIYVLVDNSGSMGGEKKRSALAICARLEEIFKGLVPLKIAAFDTSAGTNFEIIKNWNDDFVKNCSWNYLKYSRGGGGTPTKEALLVARGELVKRTEKHKLIILITDETAYCANHYLTAAIDAVRKSGIQLSAAYIEESIGNEARDAFERLFGKGDALVAEPDELCGAILPVVKKFTAK